MIINPKQQDKIRDLAQRFELRLFVLFGSQAKDQAGPDSDFDLAYYPTTPISFDNELLIIRELEEIFHSNQVQLVNLYTASPLLLKQVVDKGMPLYENAQSAFNEFYLYAMRLYYEAQPLFELRRQRLNELIK